VCRRRTRPFDFAQGGLFAEYEQDGALLLWWFLQMRLREKGSTIFLPLLPEIHCWSDRRKSVEVPLFSCYVFVRITPNNKDRLKVLRTDGVFNFVGGSRDAQRSIT
jgi:transcription antitermination factor NusG